ncbi:DUF4190 domain-containing protein [Plantactinospora siamensis]|uniref:DUF4190 domain-containing protein n=1 Tax=Plantactinospora siamensis TaxID=555372 RepID=A0ABV6NVI7_9ACTN
MTYPSQPGGSEQPSGGWTDPTEPTRQFSGPPAQPGPAYPASGPAAPGYPSSGAAAPGYPAGAPGYQTGAPGYQYPGQPAGPTPGYPYGYGQPVPAQRPNNTLALVSMILALVGVATCITAPVGAILGHVAMKQIRERGEGGEGMAKTGIIVGWILTGLLVLLLIGYGIAIAFAIKNGDTSSADTGY